MLCSMHKSWNTLVFKVGRGHEFLIHASCPTFLILILSTTHWNKTKGSYSVHRSTPPRWNLLQLLLLSASMYSNSYQVVVIFKFIDCPCHGLVVRTRTSLLLSRSATTWINSVPKWYFSLSHRVDTHQKLMKRLCESRAPGSCAGTRTCRFNVRMRKQPFDRIFPTRIDSSDLGGEYVRAASARCSHNVYI